MTFRFHALVPILAGLGAVVVACSQDLTVQSGDKEIGKTCTTQNDCPFYLACDLGTCRQRCSAKLACATGETCSSRGTCASASVAPGDDTPGDDAPGDDTDAGSDPSKIETIRSDLPADLVDLVVAPDGFLYTVADTLGIVTATIAPATVVSAPGIRSTPFVFDDKIYFVRASGAAAELVVADTSVGTPPFSTTAVAAMAQAYLGGYRAAGGKDWLVYYDAAGALTFFDRTTGSFFTPVGNAAYFFVFGGRGVHVASGVDGSGFSSVSTISFTPNPDGPVTSHNLTFVPPPELTTSYVISGGDTAFPTLDLYTIAPSTPGEAKGRRYTVNLQDSVADFGANETIDARAPTFHPTRFQHVFNDTGKEWIYSSSGAIYRVPYPKSGVKAVELAKTSTVGSAVPVTVTVYDGYVYWVEAADGKSAIKRVKY